MTTELLIDAVQTTQPDDPVVWRCDLQRKCGVSSETMRRWLRANKLPEPDVQLSGKSTGWKASTLRAAGIKIV